MRYGVYLPNFGPLADVGLLAGLAGEAEAVGWDGFFLWDHLAGWAPDCADVTVALTAVALATKRLRFGPLVTPLPRRRPQKVARESVSLDRLSGGRLVLGVGIGDGTAEWADLGEQSDQRIRGAMLDEGLEVLEGLWSGRPVQHAGAHYTVRGHFARAVQSPRIPVWVAGGWPGRRPFVRAARWDGVFPVGRDTGFDAMMGAEDLAAVVAMVSAHRADAAGPFDVVHWGVSPAGPDDPTANLAAYAAAGATWWLENISPWPYGWSGSGKWPLEAMRRRLRQGPPAPG